MLRRKLALQVAPHEAPTRLSRPLSPHLFTSADRFRLGLAPRRLPDPLSRRVPPPPTMPSRSAGALLALLACLAGVRLRWAARRRRAGWRFACWRRCRRPPGFGAHAGTTRILTPLPHCQKACKDCWQSPTNPCRRGGSCHGPLTARHSTHGPHGVGEAHSRVSTAQQPHTSSGLRHYRHKPQQAPIRHHPVSGSRRRAAPAAELAAANLPQRLLPHPSCKLPGQADAASC